MPLQSRAVSSTRAAKLAYPFLRFLDRFRRDLFRGLISSRSLRRRGRAAHVLAVQTQTLESRKLLTTIVVSTTADVIDAEDGLTSLREAVIQANSLAGDDVIQLAAGTYLLSLTGAGESAAATGDLDIAANSRLTIVGLGADQTTISASGLGDRILDVFNNARVRIEGLKLTGGTTAASPSSDRDGGAIRSVSGKVTVANCTVTGNSCGEFGAGIYNAGGELTVIDSLFSQNSASLGGGGAIFSAGSLFTVTNCNFDDNDAGFGGAIINYAGVLNLTGGSFNQNDAVHDGGAICNYATIRISDCLFTHNTASYGGAMHTGRAGHAELTRCTFKENTAEINGGAVRQNLASDLIASECLFTQNSAYSGGAIETDNSTLTLSDCTLIDNSATNFGGAIRQAAEATITRCTISGNTAMLGGGIGQMGGRLTIDSSTLSDNHAQSGGGLYRNTTSWPLIQIRNTTFSYNTATTIGGGVALIAIIDDPIYYPEKGVIVEHSTFVGNRADSDGDGDGVGGGIANGGMLTLRDSIVVGNLRGLSGMLDDLFAVEAIEAGSNYNILSADGTVGGLTNGTNGNFIGVGWTTVLDPNLADNGGPTLTHALLPGSLAIDGGDPGFNNPALSTDQRGDGFGRVRNGRIDIGAFEVQVANPPQFVSPNVANARENQTFAIDVEATDTPSETTLLYSITGGEDSDRFQIDSSSGELTFQSAPDFEHPTDADQDNVYRVTVQVGNGTHTASQEIQITVTDVNDAPVLVLPRQTVAYSKKGVKRNGDPHILSEILVNASEQFVIGGGKLTISLDLAGKTTKKFFIAYDLINGVDRLFDLGGVPPPFWVGDRVHYRVFLNERTTAADVQAYLRSLTFNTKGKALKIPTRLLQVQLTDASGTQSSLVEQVINVAK